MGWLNTIFDFAGTAVEYAQLSRLENLLEQQAEAEIIQTMLQELRNRIFKYKEAAQEILSIEEDPKIAAGMMRVLEMRMQDSGITPDIFPDLSDKEYVASVIRSVRENSQRLMTQLSPEEQEEVNEMTTAARHLPGYRFYLQTYDDALKLREAKQLKAELEGRNSCLVQGVVGVIGLTALFALPAGIGSLVGQDRGWGYFIGLGLWAAIFIPFQVFVVRSKEFKRAKETVEKLEPTTDLEHFEKLERLFGTSYDKVVQRQKHDRAVIERFFAGSGRAPLLAE